MMIRKQSAITLFIISSLLVITSAAFAQDPQPSLVASASGDGTIKLGKETFKLNGVVAKGFQDGKIEINLITDITVFITGTWSRAKLSALNPDFLFDDLGNVNEVIRTLGW